MTPQELAQDVFSLAPGKDRLALTIEMEFDRNGNRTDTDVYESVVNTEHLTYPHVDSILEAEDELEDFYEDTLLEEDEAQDFRDMARNISDAKELADKLRRNRWDESLLVNDRDSDSSKIVEELMTEANSAVGDYLTENYDVGLFRVEPEPEDPLSETAAGVLEDHDYDPQDLEGNIHRDPVRTLNNFFQRTEDSQPGVDTIRDDEEHEREVRTDIIKNLERARFKPSLNGNQLHDGLDILDYAQSTSPIRRLPDLWNHRILKGEDWSWSKLVEVAETSTQQQMIADEASRVWYDAST
jgi:ribonuclease R